MRKKSLFLESILRILLKEVVIQYHANLLKQASRNVLATEDVIDVSALTINFFSEPSHWFLSIFQDLFDSLSDVHTMNYLRVCLVFLHLSATKVRKKMRLL